MMNSVFKMFKRDTENETEFPKPFEGLNQNELMMNVEVGHLRRLLDKHTILILRVENALTVKGSISADEYNRIIDEISG